MFSRFVFLVATTVVIAGCAPQKPISRPGAPQQRPAPMTPSPAQNAPVYEVPAITEPAAEASPAPVDGSAGSNEAVRLALLLPQSGTLTSSSEAIRDGFFAAHYGAGGLDELRIYDTGGDVTQMRAAYASALREGAQVIVGPLRKEEVQALAEAGTPPVPVLALNFLDNDRPGPSRFYQLGLSAEDEAAAAASDAAAQGLRRALTLTPDDDWGERARRAFEQAFLAQGGVVSRAERYNAAALDYSEPIRALLSIDASNERYRALSALLGTRPAFEPRRRADADLIFFAARGEAVRQMAPQLRFNRASGLPLYATAQVYAGPETSADINGVRFCDGPWITDSRGVWADARNEAQALFPRRAAELTRLSALGYDAYTLARRLALQRPPESALPAATGRLQVNVQGVFKRELNCVEVAGAALKATR